MSEKTLSKEQKTELDALDKLLLEQPVQVQVEILEGVQKAIINMIDIKLKDAVINVKALEEEKGIFLKFYRQDPAS